MSKADPLTAEQCMKFIETAERSGKLMYAALFTFQLVTMARITEALRMTRGEMIDENGDIRSVIVRDVLKKRRSVKADFTIPENARTILRKWLDRARENLGAVQDSCPVFITGHGHRPVNPRTVNKIYAKIAKRAGIEAGVKTHTPRVSACILQYLEYISEGYDSLDAAYMVQDSISHENVLTTIRYLRLKRSDRRKVADILGKALPVPGSRSITYT